MHLFRWIESELKPQQTTSDQAIYEQMASQSGCSLPVIYKPFDASLPSHWNDRGSILDFLESVGEGDILDFGPGDGWPSLLMAPFARSVVGIDASPRRVEVCQENAVRLGIQNFAAVRYRAGAPLPFADASFDGVVAASSLEQSPDPVAILKELRRVLRPGGRLRIWYESLEGYRGEERTLQTWAPDSISTQLLLIDRRIEEERAVYYSIQLALPIAEFAARLGVTGRRPAITDLTVDAIARLHPLVAQASTYQLSHPRCETWLARLNEAGFRSCQPTHWGGRIAQEWAQSLSPEQRPTDMAGVDALLRPLVKVACSLEVPSHLSPPITATK